MPTYSHAPESRKARLTFARQTRALVAELNAITLDGDLSAEAKARRAAPVRAKLAAMGKEAKAAADVIVADARAAALARRPATIRRDAAFMHPERVVAVRALLEGASAAELLAFAKMATAEKDVAACYAIAATLDARLQTIPEDQANPVRAELDRLHAAEAEIARTDYLVARTEAIRLEAEAAGLTTAGELDASAMLQQANREMAVELVPGRIESLTTAQLEAAYTSTGVSIEAPGELLAVVQPPRAGAPARYDAMDELRAANRPDVASVAA